MENSKTGNFIIYQASAGSGKTFNLARIFIEALLSKTGDSLAKNLRGVMAITFTKKAANEMKERVISFLNILASEPESDPTKQVLLRDISKKTKLSYDEINERAAIMLKIIMENYSDLSIGTIDSFNQRIVRSFARELGVNFEFDINLDKNQYLEQVIDKLFDRFGTKNENDELSKALIEFFLSQLEDEKDNTWNLKYLLNEFSKKNFNDERYDLFQKHPELNNFNLNRININLKIPIENYIKEIKQLGSRGLNLINNAGLEAADFYYPNSGIYPFFENASKGEKIFDLPKSAVNKALNENVWTKKKPSLNAQNNLPAIESELHDLLRQLVDKKEAGQQFRINELILKQIHYLLLIRFVDSELKTLKEEENTLLIDDFNRLIDRVVKNEPVPFIYEKIGARYKHYLIDEFQDTAIKQWHNFVPLIDNALSAGNQNLIVGDGKQAIYRWRSGEVELFNKLPEIYKADGELFNLYEQNFIREQDILYLENNYRSRTEIVEFNNDFYEALKENLGDFKSVYQNHKQKPVKSTGGYVKIEVLDKIQIKEEDLYLKKTLLAIQESIEDGFFPGQIAVLARKRNSLKAIAEYLTKNNITIESSESLMLKNQEGIQFLVSILKYILNPDDKVIQYWLFYFLANKFDADPNIDFQTISDEFDPAKKKLKELGLYNKLKQLGPLPLYQMAIELEKEFKIDISLSAYFKTFLDLVEQFESKDGKQLDGFIEWWDELKPSISTPDNPEAVKLLTIHSAKGLEFPVVIFPYADWMKQLTNEYKWIDAPDEIADELPKVLLKLSKGQLENTPREMAYFSEKSKSLLDDINLMYVATTRPSERLYIFTSSEISERFLSAQVNKALATLNIGDRHILEYGERVKKEFLSPQITDGIIMDLELKSIDTTEREDVINVSYEHVKYQNEKIKKALDYGKTIHRLLAEIDTTDDIEFAVKNALNTGLISKKESTELNTKLTRLLCSGNVKQWFEQGGVKIKERSLADKNGNELRPDRIVISDDQVTVIDYKTGVVSDGELVKYKSQVLGYMEALENMDYKNVKGYLLAIDNEELIPV
jgi:ATP-dependent exoDNAse (exonuclease V) beta subunit